MEGTKQIAVTIVAVVFMLIGSSEPATYTVGDNEKWNTGVNYFTWAQQYTFFVGDTLVFEYVKGDHNVYDVTDEAYRSCNQTDGVYVKYVSGNDTIELKKPKKYYYICNIEGHCFSGMRFVVDVGASTNSTTTTSPTSLSPPPPPPGTNHSSRHHNVVLAWTLFVVTFVLFTY